MTRGLVRYQQGGGFHFVTFSCFHRLPLLGTACARELFESALERIRVRYQIAVAGYVVMPEHVHILMSEPRNGLLARALQALKLSVARRRDESPFWQARYYDFNVHLADKMTEKLRYIHRNPVKRGLVDSPRHGNGRVSVTMQLAIEGQSRSSRFGQRRSVDMNFPKDSKFVERWTERS